MKNLYVGILIILLFSSVLVVGQSTQLSDMDGFIQTYIDTTHKAGISASIIKDDTVVWKGCFGYANLDDSIPVTDSTLFNAMSISKTITATCLMMQWENGLITLDENVNGILPFQIDNPSQNPDFITPRQIMTHSSCIIDNNWLQYLVLGDPTTGLGEFLEDYLSPGGAYYSSNNFSSLTPGTIPAYSYSNIGYGLNGYLIEVCNPLPISFNSFVKTYIHEPLAMNRSAWFLDELNMDNLATGYSYNGSQYNSWEHYGVPFYPAMALRTNVNELSQYLIMMLNKGDYFGEIILQPETVDSMFTLQYNFNYTGLGLRREIVYCNTNNKIKWGHKGGGAYGFSGEIQFCREENTAILYLTNSSSYSPELVQRMFEYAAMIVIATEADSINKTEFKANWQSAPDAESYLFDLAYDSVFSNIVSPYQNFETGLDTGMFIDGLMENTNYYYRARAINEYDTGAYSNVRKVHTRSNVGSDELCIYEPVIWYSNNMIYIDDKVPDNNTFVKVYSIDGKLLKTAKINYGQNHIDINTKNQLVIVSVSGSKTNFSKKLFVN